MTYSEAIRWLYELQWFGLKLGLENTLRLAELAGDPQRDLRFIHVAGTNGKGSTCAMLESIYRAAGWRVGLFTSPHLVSFRERLQVNRQPITETEVRRLVSEVREWVGTFPPPGSPTFFEVVTVMALRHFAAAGCELVIWETGLGGRLDATNIVTPLASVITNIQFDHEKWLGDTLSKIAAEKAGIIKPGIEVLTGTDEPEALAVIRATAARQRAPLVELGPGAADQPPLDRLWLPLVGEHQRRNAALAVATVRALQAVLPVSRRALETGLSTVDWPGRFQILAHAPGRVTVLDGAHNPAGVATLRAALEQRFPGRRIALILGVLKDKDWVAMCQTLCPVAGSICLVPVASNRSAAPEELQEVCQQAQPILPVTTCGSLLEALRQTHGAAVRVICGSLYLVGEALELLDVPGTWAASERGLNDWAPAPADTAGVGHR